MGYPGSGAKRRRTGRVPGCKSLRKQGARACWKKKHPVIGYLMFAQCYSTFFLRSRKAGVTNLIRCCRICRMPVVVKDAISAVKFRFLPVSFNYKTYNAERIGPQAANFKIMTQTLHQRESACLSRIPHRAYASSPATEAL